MNLDHRPYHKRQGQPYYGYELRDMLRYGNNRAANAFERHRWIRWTVTVICLLPLAAACAALAIQLAEWIVG